MVYSSLGFTCFWLSRGILTSNSSISSKHNVGEGEYLIDFDPNQSNLLRNSHSSFINRENNINSLDRYFSPLCVFLCYLSFWFVLGKLFFLYFLILKLWFCIFSCAGICVPLQEWMTLILLNSQNHSGVISRFSLLEIYVSFPVKFLKQGFLTLRCY